MDDRASKTYRPWEPHRYAQEAHAPAAKLPEGDLVFFLLDIVPQLDLSRFYAYYEDETRGAPPFDPAEMVCLLLYAYCVGIFSSRKIALACERNFSSSYYGPPPLVALTGGLGGRSVEVSSEIPSAVSATCNSQINKVSKRNRSKRSKRPPRRGLARTSQ